MTLCARLVVRIIYFHVHLMRGEVSCSLFNTCEETFEPLKSSARKTPPQQTLIFYMLEDEYTYKIFAVTTHLFNGIA
jgi:hypothetical protein